KERGLPAVLVNAAIEGLGFPVVSADDRVAVRQAFGHLKSLWHTTIGLLVGPSAHVPSGRKVDEFPDLPVARTLYSMEGAQAAATRLIKEGVTRLTSAT